MTLLNPNTHNENFEIPSSVRSFDYGFIRACFQKGSGNLQAYSDSKVFILAIVSQSIDECVVFKLCTSHSVGMKSQYALQLWKYKSNSVRRID